MGKSREHDSFQLSLLSFGAGFGLPVDNPVWSFIHMIEDEIDLTQIVESRKAQIGGWALAFSSAHDD